MKYELFYRNKWENSTLKMNFLEFETKKELIEFVLENTKKIKVIDIKKPLNFRDYYYDLFERHITWTTATTSPNWITVDSC